MPEESSGTPTPRMSTLRFTTPRTVRCVQVGSFSESTTHVWLACHGYGMDVERFARWFEGLPADHVVLCPEGLSRFYWGGFDGPPGASWMTRAERLHEIDDFCAWLDQVYSLALKRAPHAHLIPFGFSQGAATILRWLDRRRPPYHKLVLWSGTPPEDIDYAPRAYYRAGDLLAYWGDADELVPFERTKPRFAEVGLPGTAVRAPELCGRPPDPARGTCGVARGVDLADLEHRAVSLLKPPARLTRPGAGKYYPPRASARAPCSGPAAPARPRFR